jgi:hypothetical protein
MQISSIEFFPKRNEMFNFLPDADDEYSISFLIQHVLKDKELAQINYSTYFRPDEQFRGEARAFLEKEQKGRWDDATLDSDPFVHGLKVAEVVRIYWIRE